MKEPRFPLKIAQVGMQHLWVNDSLQAMSHEQECSAMTLSAVYVFL